MQINTGATEQPIPESSLKGKTLLVPFILICSLFFLWGMVHNLDGILIPHLKKACQLNNRQSTLVDTAIFLAYFVMAIPAGILLKKIGYKKSIIVGLLLATIGAALFIPAANALAYLGFLGSLFVIGCGIAILETAANPYSAILGNPAGATTRINLAAAFNGAAATVAPYVGGMLILSGKEYTRTQLDAMPAADKSAYLLHEASSVKLPYGILAATLAVVAICFILSKLPEIKNISKEESSGGSFLGALKHRHLLLAVLAQFFYVGAQVCVTSFFIRMAKQGAGIDEKSASVYLGLYYGLLFMGGRFIGTAILSVVKSHKLLTVYAVMAALLCTVCILGKGEYVVYCLGAMGFFMSIMFPTIFALGIDGLGDDTKPASSWLIMSIVGGAILPYLMGTVIDFNHDNIQAGYIVPLLCFLFIVYFGTSGYKIKKQVIKR
ncbi:L-fucose:H+ symporter permease [Mucilaginibacter sp. PPCGB 2223]|uniref:L-fucose:H+ symporter permease n=1 Tax=Mucilaginibacter sp. PPCGB 2223 TaxID=1886027 RepID=UPI000826C12A|nr:L-fucose:H+ symporter permease [Mucilaginibacter sp. PPCGB 2223]OCX53020.1 L-fucose:H+ symporter permease [Mucilaginibacter sp. PPCGB 2223]